MESLTGEMNKRKQQMSQLLTFRVVQIKHITNSVGIQFPLNSDMLSYRIGISIHLKMNLRY